MVNQSIVNLVMTYLKALKERSVPVAFGVLYGSQVSGEADEWSDIDLLVVSPMFDKEFTFEDVSLLWRTAARIDSRIEPVPVGLARYETDDGSPLLVIARRQGQVIPVSE